MVMILLILAGFVAVSSGLRCFDQECPDGTLTCHRQIKTINDKSQMETTISCMSSDGNVIQRSRSITDNALGPYADFQSNTTSFSLTTGSGNFSIPGLTVSISNNFN